MIGFQWTVTKFLWYQFLMYFTLLYFTFYGMMTIAMTPTQQIGQICSSAFYGIWNLFSGFLVPRTVSVHFTFPDWRVFSTSRHWWLLKLLSFSLYLDNYRGCPYGGDGTTGYLQYLGLCMDLLHHSLEIWRICSTQVKQWKILWRVTWVLNMTFWEWLRLLLLDLQCYLHLPLHFASWCLITKGDRIVSWLLGKNVHLPMQKWKCFAISSFFYCLLWATLSWYLSEGYFTNF